MHLPCLLDYDLMIPADQMSKHLQDCQHCNGHNDGKGSASFYSKFDCCGRFDIIQEGTFSMCVDCESSCLHIECAKHCMCDQGQARCLRHYTEHIISCHQQECQCGQALSKHETEHQFYTRCEHHNTLIHSNCSPCIKCL